MYDPMRMHYGGMGGYGGYPAGYPGYDQQQYHQQFPANNYPAFNGPSQQQQPCDAYNGANGQQWSGWEQQQQQQQWMHQGAAGGNMDWSNWGAAGRPASRHQAHMSPPQQHAAHMSPPQHQSQQPQQPTTTANNNNNSESYLRTLQYVKNCQSWSSNSGVGSPPDYNQQQQQQSAVPQSKKPVKTSPAHNPASMPPPTTTGIVPPMHMAAGLQMGPGNNMLGAGMPHGPAMGMGGGHKPDENMVLGDMHSSMNALMEENRYLQMMQ